MLYKLLLLTGLILFSISIYHLKESIAFIDRGERALGTVTLLDEDDEGSYTPVFTIKTNEGMEVFYRHPASTNPPSWHVGDQATFIYDPINPRSAKLMGYFWLFNWAIVFMAMAVPLIIIGVGHLVLNPAIRAKNEEIVSHHIK